MDFEPLFLNNAKICKLCQRPLPLSYPDDVCPNCHDREVFNEVKEYIRTHNVNEYQVAEHFSLPLRQVKSWIRDGRIEYKSTSKGGTISGLHCQRCGTPVSFGTLCPQCLRLLNGNKGYGIGPDPGTQKSKMYHLDGEE